MIVNIQTPEDDMQRNIQNRQLLAKSAVVRYRKANNTLAGTMDCPNCHGELTFEHDQTGKIAASCNTTNCVDFESGGDE